MTADSLAERAALGETVRAVLRRHADTDPWPVLCAQVGVAALAVPEAYGGAGAGVPELAVVARELGRELVACPFLGSSVLTTLAILEAGNPTDHSRLLPGLAEGTSTAALAWTSAAGRWCPEEVACAVTASGDRCTVDGSAHYVLDGDTADLLLVFADTGHGLALVEVDPDQRGVRRAGTPAMDQSRSFARVDLTRAAGRRLGSGDARPGLRHVRDLACAVLAAEQAGAAARALEITVAYSLEREQFGRPIGGFQALKHRMADLHVLVETARSAAEAAAEPGPHQSRMAAVAKAWCSRALSEVTAEMIQLHGGIGITWEHPAHRYFKRAHGSAELFGPPHQHLARLGRMAGVGV
ncbi:hypothetical protein SAMN05216266_112130 [Amycolatopsis marina]|uniref:Acyl-CoA dehydrogenase n=1 Tax=Amycolatopsis marina TaxID=490629 RepID=A0A1I1B6I9_9PSEU|nr:acyl-CoA dehydrogenase family protein [Amycolatopsis marina]SFB45985.1 hypothetical protein SAMN05216266_112130 [Amycolatopsis marina]